MNPHFIVRGVVHTWCWIGMPGNFIWWRRPFAFFNNPSKALEVDNLVRPRVPFALLLTFMTPLLVDNSFLLLRCFFNTSFIILFFLISNDGVLSIIFLAPLDHLQEHSIFEYHCFHINRFRLLIVKPLSSLFHLIQKWLMIWKRLCSCFGVWL